MMSRFRVWLAGVVFGQPVAPKAALIAVGQQLIAAKQKLLEARRALEAARKAVGEP